MDKIDLKKWVLDAVASEKRKEIEEENKELIAYNFLLEKLDKLRCDLLDLNCINIEDEYEEYKKISVPIEVIEEYLPIEYKKMRNSYYTLQNWETNNELHLKVKTNLLEYLELRLYHIKADLLMDTMTYEEFVNEHQLTIENTKEKIKQCEIEIDKLEPLIQASLKIDIENEIAKAVSASEMEIGNSFHEMYFYPNK